MKSTIVCKSVHHGNTMKVARVMADVLDADLFTPEDARSADLDGYDLYGFGSGIYAFRHHPSILNLVPDLRVSGGRSFIFSTYGLGPVTLYHRSLRRRLHGAGIPVVGEFSCKGLDRFAFLRLIGGINRGRPNDEDLRLARCFAVNLQSEMAGEVG